jgi:hypothetical protein
MIFELNGDFWMILLILTMMTLVIVGLGNHASHFRLNGGASHQPPRFFWEIHRENPRDFSEIFSVMT